MQRPRILSTAPALGLSQALMVRDELARVAYPVCALLDLEDLLHDAEPSKKMTVGCRAEETEFR